MKNEKISIIIPVYNSEKYLNNCLESIINQSYKNLQIVIVNDGSTDNSDFIIKEYEKNDNRIDYYKIKNHGVSYARNYGIKRADGKYIMFVDSDDIVSNDFCDILLKNLVNNNAQLSVCGYDLIYKNELKKDEFSQALIIEDNKYELLFDVFKGYLCNKLYVKKIIIDNKLLLNKEIHMCEDLLFNFEYLNKTKRISYTPSKLYGYLIADNSSRKISDKWFSIFKCYQKIYNEHCKYLSGREKDILDFYYLNVIFESKVRCRLLNKKLTTYLNNEELDLVNNVIKKVNVLLLSKELTIEKRIKLFMYYKLFFVSYFIKKNRIVKG